MDDNSFFKQRLLEASRTKDLTRRLSLILVTAAVASLVFLVVALVDYWLMLPATVRFGGVLLLGLILVAGIIRLVAAMRRPTGLKEAALDAEATKPEAGCELSTAAEYLGGKRKPTEEFESKLAAALEAKAGEHLRSTQVPYWNRPIPAAAFLSVCGIALLLFGFAASGAFTALKRAAAPWSDTPYTRVEVQPGNIEIPVGKDVDIKSVFSGRVPHTAQFAWQDEGSAKWQTASLARNERGEYIYPLKNIRTALSYQVSGSDAVSPAFKVEPYTPPEVRDWRVELDLPEYARRPKLVQNSPEISVLRGASAWLQIAPSVKLSRAHLRFEDGTGLDLKPRDNGFWTTDFKVTKDAKFWMELADAKGHTGTNETPYEVKALPDDAPKVEIPDPGQDMRAAASNSVPVKISVTDDYGIQEIRLVYHKLGGPEQVITVKRDNETNSEFSAEIPLSSLGLQEFELVAYYAEATDNNTLDGPGVGKSDVYFIEITDQEAGKGKSQAKSQRVNLLVIQKQIIADTTALAAGAPAEKFQELAKREQDAVDFGKIYTEALSAGGPAPARQEMEAAIADMQKTQGALEKQLRAAALPPSESALAHLYQVLRLMPELKDLPTKPQKMPESKTNKPPLLNVVLGAMKKKSDQPEDKELADALQQAEQLRDEQNAVNIGAQSSGEGKGSGETKLVRAGNEAKNGEGKAPAKAKGNKGKGTGKGGKNKGQPKKGEGTGKPAENKPEDQKGEEQKPNEEPKDDQLAEKEEELSKEATALAEKLERLAGKDTRLGHTATGKMNQAAASMAAAAQAMKRSEQQIAGTKGAESTAALEGAIASLEQALRRRTERVDVSQEESPKEYETVIAEYLKKLSYDQ